MATSAVYTTTLDSDKLADGRRVLSGHDFGMCRYWCKVDGQDVCWFNTRREMEDYIDSLNNPQPPTTSFKATIQTINGKSVYSGHHTDNGHVVYFFRVGDDSVCHQIADKATYEYLLKSEIERAA